MSKKTEVKDIEQIKDRIASYRRTVRMNTHKTDEVRKEKLKAIDHIMRLLDEYEPETLSEE